MPVVSLMLRAGLLALIVFASGITGDWVMAQAEAVEQPKYDVIGQVGPVEIRQYGPRLAAETDMGPGTGVRTGQYTAFMALADFIFATNRGGPAVEMTAPVAIDQSAEPIAMTAPVAVEPGDQGRVMRFFMPSKYTLDTLPKPTDDRVRIITVPAQTLAVVRYSGENTDDAVAEHTAELLAALKTSDWEPVGEAGTFGYDAPMTPPADRRNEVFVEVRATNGATPAAGTPPAGTEGP